MEPLHLALDTSTSRPVVALLRGNQPLHHWVGSEELRHHETLLPGIHHCLNGAGERLANLAFLTVGVGPGTFTGLRIGVATAKFLADPLGLPCVAVSSLVCLAQQGGRLAQQVTWAVSDAKSKRVYALRLAPGELSEDFHAPAGEDHALSPAEAAAKMQPGEFLIGEGAALYAGQWPAGVDRPTEAAADQLDPIALGRIGWHRFQRGLTCTALALQPTYLKTGQPHL